MTGRREPTIRSAGGRVISTDKVTEVGCDYFLAHGTLDMEGLAAALSVSRATLYRVVNNRDRLLGEVLWRLAERGLDRARAARTTTGIDGVLEVTARFAAEVLATEPFATFLAAEPDVASKVLFSPTCNVYRRLVATVRDIFVEATPAQGPWLTGDLDGLAYLYVRIFESTFYAEMLAGVRPDPELAEHMARALLVDACQAALPALAGHLPRPRRLLHVASWLAVTMLPALASDEALTLAGLTAR